jgi:hypothetical protein
MASDSHTNGRPHLDDVHSSGGSAPRDAGAPARRRYRPAAVATGVAIGVALAILGGLALLFATRGERVPEITIATLDAAEELWNKRGPASYRMGIAVGGRQPGPVEIEVRDGRITRMTRNGVTPQQERTWEYWTVPAQFETIREDLDSAQREGGFGAPAGTKTIIRASFDPNLGYPLRYQRMVLGTDLNLDWTVTSFESLEGAAATKR